MSFPTQLPLASPWIRRFGAALGWLALATTLALTAPGVVATAKGEPAARASGPSCAVAERSGESTAIRISQMIERLRADAAAQVDPSDEVVALDNRGFSYDPVPAPAPTAPPARPADR